MFFLYSKKVQSITGRYNRMRYVTASVNETLKKVCSRLGIEDKIRVIVCDDGWM